MDDVVRAGLWGFLAASALPLGPRRDALHALDPHGGAIMAFGAGTLITAVTFELVDQAFERADLWPVVLGLGLGAAFTVGDAILVRPGVDDIVDGHRAGPQQGDGGLPIALGAVLDGFPESLVLGISLASGGAVSPTFLIAVFVSNVPEFARSAAACSDRLPTRSRAWALDRGRFLSGIVAAFGASSTGSTRVS